MQRREDDFSNADTETVMPYGSNDLTVAEMHEVLSELCLLLKVFVVRTNETKHGHVEIQVRHEIPEPPQAPALADAQAEIARLRGALEEYAALKDEVIGLRQLLKGERAMRKELEDEDFGRRYNQTTYGL